MADPKDPKLVNTGGRVALVSSLCLELQINPMASATQRGHMMASGAKRNTGEAGDHHH